MLMFGVVALSSCEKSEDQDTVRPDFEQGTLSHILVDSAEVSTYNFAGKQLSQINHFDQETGELESYEKLEHDAKGKLIKATTHAGSNHAVLSEETYVYAQNGLLDQTTTSYYSGGKVEYNSFTQYDYNTNNKLEKKSVFEGEGKSAKAKSFTKYEVLPNGNYSQEKQYVVDDKGEASLFSTTTYSYDSNLNPFFAMAQPGTASSPNNLIAATTVVNSSQKTYKYAYAYTYDERGYPLSQTVTTPGGKRTTYTYLYSN